MNNELINKIKNDTDKKINELEKEMIIALNNNESHISRIANQFCQEISIVELKENINKKKINLIENDINELKDILNNNNKHQYESLFIITLFFSILFTIITNKYISINYSL